MGLSRNKLVYEKLKIMSIRKEEYIIIGCKFGEEFTRKLWKDSEKWEEMFDKYEAVEGGEKQWLLTDGMSGDYTFFGIINRISDGWDYENIEIVEFVEPTKEQKKEIIEKFKEVFPNEKMSKIKMYYVPHYC